MSVTVTETAAREIASIIDQQGLDAEKIRLRVGVKGGGCSGFSYLLDLTETQKETDEVWEFEYALASAPAKSETDSPSGGVALATEPRKFLLRVICDPKSLLYLEGTTIDFKDEIMGRGFVFSNPNATTTCGCGSSFSA
ncbi:MAG TPA: iron-sulfur cluster assembly accessory protein [Phycisphaerales bacterium]|nr:iron-sulfur cluster assembly accessory protein [Phycisphaerales bacterium]HMP38412.1 iron-sulfur cluster assembly accessory protein [Phycisphaerales bacterium]